MDVTPKSGALADLKKEQQRQKIQLNRLATKVNDITASIAAVWK